ncbi:MAG: DUF1343 domain-containing protein [Opitutales bacterium]
MKKLFALILCLFYLFNFTASANKVDLGIDILKEMNFKPLWNKRVGLLTHPAGVNKDGRSTIDILRSSPNVRLCALFGPEHGIYGNEKANIPVDDKIDPKTGLPVYSLYGKFRKPTAKMLAGIDVLVVDLQDVGCRSYTYISCMIRAMEACFEQGKEVVVLDRPNPLGGLKIDGPMLDMEYKSYVGMINVPYVHSLTIGEIAKMVKATPNALEISRENQIRGKLSIVPMRNWYRNMTWPKTGLKWVPTSPAIPNYAAVIGYAMSGLGTQLGSFQHGYGTDYPFRFLTYPNKTPQQIITALNKRNIKGLHFSPYKIKHGTSYKEGVYINVDDWNELRPTELSFHLMLLACEFSNSNPFAKASASDVSLYNKHVGSKQWYNEISKFGKNAKLSYFISKFYADIQKYKSWVKQFYIYE